MNKNLKKYFIVLVLCLSAATFLLPRETFDAHIGVDYDIFCKVYHGMQIDSIVSEEIITISTHTEYKFVIIAKLKTLHLATNLLTRGPPA